MSFIKNKKNYELFISPIIQQIKDDFILELGKKGKIKMIFYKI